MGMGMVLKVVVGVGSMSTRRCSDQCRGWLCLTRHPGPGKGLGGQLRMGEVGHEGAVDHLWHSADLPHFERTPIGFESCPLAGTIHVAICMGPESFKGFSKMET